jgi:hypothetical protein
MIYSFISSQILLYAHCGDKAVSSPVQRKVRYNFFPDHVTRLPSFVALSFVAVHQYYKAIQYRIDL